MLVQSCFLTFHILLITNFMASVNTSMLMILRSLSLTYRNWYVPAPQPFFYVACASSYMPLGSIISTCSRRKLFFLYSTSWGGTTNISRQELNNHLSFLPLHPPTFNNQSYPNNSCSKSVTTVQAVVICAITATIISQMALFLDQHSPGEHSVRLEISHSTVQ